MTGEFAVRSIIGETILVPIKSGVGELESILTLNETGAEILRVLQARGTVEDAAEALAAKFDISPEQALADVVEYVEILESAGVIASASAGAGSTP